MPKAACSPLYVNYRLKTNAAILWDVDHTKSRLHIGGIGQGKGTKNLKVVDVLTYRNECTNLNLAGATMESALGRSEED
jgi:hypothetical protein